MQVEPKAIRSAARAHAHSDDRRATAELVVTLALFFAGLGVGIAAVGNWPVVVAAVMLTAAMGLRTYVILHDCMHGSFFASRRLNDVVGVLLSPIAMTPYRATQHIHNLHHMHVSDLDRRDTFEIRVMTRREWERAGAVERLGYRIYRNPITLILLGPFLFFLLARRLPLCGLRSGVGDLVVHNTLLAGFVYAIWLVSGLPGLLVWLAAVYLACVGGALISYVVHNFETIHWGTKPELDFQTAALEGSAVLDWGPLFDLVTMNIGYHDLHHLNARIPGYKLKAAHADLEAQGLLTPERIGFLEGLRCLGWKLYDEDAGRMITFRQAGAGQLVPAE